MACLAAMPNEVILHIFHFMSADDLLLRARNVCTRWRELVPCARQWRNLEIKFPETMSDEDIKDWFRSSHYMTSCRLQHGLDMDSILQCMVDHRPDIKSVIIERKRETKWHIVKQMLEKYRNIETLDVLCEGIFHMDYAKMFAERFKPFSLILCTGITPSKNTSSYTDVYCDKAIKIYDHNVVKSIIEQKKASLRYLALFPIITDVTMETIYKCQELQKLTVSGEDDSVQVIYFKNLTKLKKLETLQIYISSNTRIMSGPFSSYHASRLVKLEIYSRGEFPHTEARKLWAVLPNLQHLRLRAKSLLDEAFRGIDRCQKLKHIDLSDNNPGFYNSCLYYISESRTDLEFLDISCSVKSMMYNISLLRNCYQLQHLWIRNQIVNDEQLLTIALQFPRLVYLDLGRNNYASREMLARMKSLMPNLHINIQRKR